VTVTVLLALAGAFIVGVFCGALLVELGHHAKDRQAQRARDVARLRAVEDPCGGRS
jgi:uncharacterized membrane-anchored protein YhcB (DUF1043 family)